MNEEYVEFRVCFVLMWICLMLPIIIAIFRLIAFASLLRLHIAPFILHLLGLLIDVFQLIDH